MQNVTASFLTLSGSTVGHQPRHNLVERSQVAQQFGFEGIGACADELSGLSKATMSAIAATLPCPVTELEWFDLGAPAKHCAKTLFDAADAFGAHRVNVGVCHDWSPRKGRIVLRNFAEEAETHGIDVAVEPVAFGALWDPREVMAVIDSTGQRNVGLLLDTWQMTYAMHDAVSSFEVPWNRISEVQLAGSYRQGHTMHCAMERCLPGHKGDESDVLSWYQQFRAHHPLLPVSVEVTSTTLRKQKLPVTAGMVMAALDALETASRKA
jgi:sugar phosphate isomerase/epimerase